LLALFVASALLLSHGSNLWWEEERRLCNPLLHVSQPVCSL
jgi:hypothetical protein